MTILVSKYGHKTCIFSAFIFDTVHLRVKMFPISFGMQYLSHHSVYFVIQIDVHSAIGSGSTPGSRFHTPGPVYVLASGVCELDVDPGRRDLCAVAAIDKFTPTTKILWGKRDGMATL